MGLINGLGRSMLSARVLVGTTLDVPSELDRREMAVLSTDRAVVTIETADAPDDADVFAGKAPIPGDPKKMGQVIHAVLSDRSNAAAQ